MAWRKEQRLQRGDEILEDDRLGPVVGEAGAERTGNVVRHRVGRQRDAGDGRGARVGTQPAQHLEAVEIGQLHVDQHEVGPQVDGAGHAARAVGLAGDLQVGEAAHEFLHERHVHLVVLDVEDGAVARARTRGWRQRGHRHLRRHARDAIALGRQRDGEHRAEARLAARLDGAAHALDERLDDCQADAAALDPLAFDAEPVERLEQVRDLLGAQAATTVADRQPHGRTGGQCLDVDDALRPVVLDRIGQQVDQYLQHACAVRPHQAAHRARLHAHLLRVGQALNERQHLVDQFAQRDALELEPHLAGLQARQVEHVVDQLEQVFAGMADVAQLGAPALGASAAGLDLQQLREAQHGVQRRAQLMAHAREELRLGAALPLGQGALAPRHLGLLGLGDVPVHADAADHLALRVEHRRRARGEPAQPAAGQQHAELVARHAFAAEDQRVRVGVEAAVVRVHDRQALLAGGRARRGLEAAQAEHLLVPAFEAAGEVALPGADAGAACGEAGALVGAAQRDLREMLLGDVDGHAEDQRAALPRLAARAVDQPAHLPVGPHDAVAVLDHRRRPAEQARPRAAHRRTVVGVHDAAEPLLARRCAERRVAAAQGEHLRIPACRRVLRVRGPDADLRRLGGDLELARQLGGLALPHHLLGHVERDADERERAAVGRPLLLAGDAEALAFPGPAGSEKQIPDAGRPRLLAALAADDERPGAARRGVRADPAPAASTAAGCARSTLRVAGGSWCRTHSLLDCRPPALRASSGCQPMPCRSHSPPPTWWWC